MAKSGHASLRAKGKEKNWELGKESLDYDLAWVLQSPFLCFPEGGLRFGFLHIFIPMEPFWFLLLTSFSPYTLSRGGQTLKTQ